MAASLSQRYAVLTSHQICINQAPVHIRKKSVVLIHKQTLLRTYHMQGNVNIWKSSEKVIKIAIADIVYYIQGILGGTWYDFLTIFFLIFLIPTLYLKILRHKRFCK